MSSSRVIKGNVTARPYGMPVLQSKYRRGHEAETLSPEETARLEKLRLDEIEREAREKGFAKGREEAEKKAAAIFDELNSAAEDLKVFTRQRIDELEPQVVELARNIARKILIEEISMDPAKLVRVVKEALLRLEKTGPITIRINPAIYEIFLKHRHDLLEAHNDLVFESDPLASKNGPVVSGSQQEAVTDVSELFDNLMEDMSEKLDRS